MVHVFVVILVSCILKILALGQELSVYLSHDILLELWVDPVI